MESSTSTKSEFREISKYSDMKDLAKKISKLTKINNDVVYNIIKRRDIDDEEIYSTLHEQYKNIQQIDKTEKSSKYRAGGITDQIIKVLKNTKYNNNNLLDIGCGDCSITINFANRLKIKNVPKCVDVKNWFDNYEVKDKKCAVRYTNGKFIPYADKSMDIILALHSIHHMKHADKMIREISRVIKDTGLLIIREHDCENEKTKLFVDIIHSIYEMVIKEKPDPNYLTNYFAKYYSFNHLKKILEENSFKFINLTEDNSNMKNYVALFRKNISSIEN